MFNVYSVIDKEKVASFAHSHHATVSVVAMAKDAYENMHQSESEEMQQEFDIIDWETAKANDDVVKWFFMIIEE